MGDPDWVDGDELGGLRKHLRPFVGMIQLDGGPGIPDIRGEIGSVYICSGFHYNCGISRGCLSRLQRIPRMAGFGWQLGVVW